MKVRLFASYRWRIAALFVALSSILYCGLALFANVAFEWGLNHSIDQELRVLASELGHAIELDGARPRFRDWLRVVQTNPARSLAPIQLYNAQGILIEHYGPAGPTTLCTGVSEAQHFRLIVTPLTRGSKLVGFLQIALSTTSRDDSLTNLKTTILWLAPALLIGLGVTGYIVSDLATAPIRENLQLLKQFFADASHELNTPLSVIHARAELLEKRLRRSNENIDDVQLISAASERMERTVSDLMLLAEIESFVALQAEEPCSLVEVLKEVVAEFTPKFEDRNIGLKFKPGQDVTLTASKDGLHKIISNLVENAWRYTEPGGSVTLSADCDDVFAKIEVADTGLGVPADCLPFIFDRFYRVEKSRSRASGGSGLGLSIVKALVESHKGYLNVSSQVGKGSSFTVFLPVLR